MRDEVTGDCAAREGKRWFNVKSQQTGLRSGVNLQPLGAETWVCFCWDTPDSQKSLQSEGMGKESEVKKQAESEGKKMQE